MRPYRRCVRISAPGALFTPTRRNCIRRQSAAWAAAGLPEEVVESLLREDEESRRRAPKHGSGVGLINVHKRIQLRFGTEYGLRIYSEPDEGTRVELHLPAIPDTEENRRLLEEGHYRRGGRNEGK